MAHAFEESSENLQVLESLVDKSSVTQVLEGLALICHLKAEHLATNWQDATSAKAWVKGATWLNTVAMKLDV